MHIPDGFISPSVAVTTTLTSASFLTVSLLKTRQQIGLKQTPIIALTTAFIFASQMINFPVAGGTSGHLLGATLAVLILGNPWGAMLSIATVLIIQALLFADGGITALGANIFNIGIVGVWVSWMLTKTLQRLLGGSQKRLPLVAGISAFFSTIMASICCSLQLIFSGTSSVNLILPAMTGIHILIGVGEGLITGGILTYLIKVRPDLLPSDQPKFNKLLMPIVSILLIAGVLSLFASSFPDGLEKVAENLGFIDLAENIKISLNTPFSDYQIEGINPKLGTSLTGLFGTTICFTSSFLISKFIVPKSA